MTSNQAFVTILVTIIGVIVLIALHDLDANVGLPLIAGLVGVVVPSPAQAKTTVTPVVTPVTGNDG